MVPATYIGEGGTGQDLPSHYRDSTPAIQALMGRYVQRPRGRNVFLMQDNSVTEVQPPNWDPTNLTGPTVQGYNPFTHVTDSTTLASSLQVKRVFWGGCANPVTSAEATILTNAGYTVTA